MPLRPAAGKHEPPSPPRQDQQQQHTYTHSHTHIHSYTHAANSSQGASTDSGSSREEDSGVSFPDGVQAFRPGAEHHSAGAPMEEPTGNTVVIRIGIPDLQQTVRACSVATAGERIKEREAASPPPSLSLWLGAFYLSSVCFIEFALLLLNIFIVLFFFLFAILSLPQSSSYHLLLLLIFTLRDCIYLLASGGSAPHCPFHANKSTSSLTGLQLTLTTGHLGLEQAERGREGGGEKASRLKTAIRGIVGP